MSRLRFRGLVATGTVAALGLAFAPATASLAPASPAPALVTAADLGMDFAPRLLFVDAPTLAARNAVAALGLDMTEHASNDHVEVIAYSEADLATLREAGFTWEVEVADLILEESERIAADRAFAESVAFSNLPSGRTGYRMLADFGKEIDALVAKAPAIAKRISVGTSLEGRDLTGIEIGRDVNAPEDGRPVFLMFGVHHAREWPSAEMPMEFAIDLVNSYLAGDTRIEGLLDRSRVVIVPVSNPDGYEASREASESLGEPAGGTTPTNAYKRKNCRYIPGVSQPGGTCEHVHSPLGFGIGVDLNRNYGGLWGGPGADAEPHSATYHGDAPFSEPETQAIRTLISTRQVTTLITNHTQGHLLLRPVGVAPTTIGPDGFPAGYAPDECFLREDGVDYGMQALGERMTAQNGYSNQFGWELYDTTGTTEDYSYNATGGYGYTFELMKGAFHPAFSNVVEEYTGQTAAAKAVTKTSALTLTSKAGDTCAGTHVEHTKVGGGLRESYLIALENVVDRRTHSLITGEAPAGARITVSRTGEFPLWDNSKVEDTVTTTMTVGEGGRFEYDVNPSTRPFVSSRKATVLGQPIEKLDVTNAAAPSLHLQKVNHTFAVTKPADVLSATVQAVVGATSSLAQFHLRLFDATNQELATATAFGEKNTLAWHGPQGAGVPVGNYRLQVTNAVNPGAAYTLKADTRNIESDRTPQGKEFWTVTCTVAGQVTGTQDVFVARGGSVDVGRICG